MTVSSPVPSGAALSARDPRRLALWAAAGVAGALTFAFLRAAVPLPPEVAPFCLVRRFLGIPCPGCGMTRALSHLARGEWRAALAFHPLAPLVAAELALGWAAAGLAAVSPSPARWPSWVPALLAADGALLVALWAGRLASGTWPR
jgi:hypothetical protein